jgi:hypothetical protein
MITRGYGFAPYRPSRADLDDMVSSYGTGSLIREIAAKYRKDPRTIRKVLAAAGVQIRYGPHKMAGVHRHRLDTHFFREIDTEAKAYWLGFLCADCHIWRGLRVEIGLGVVDRGHLLKLQRDAKSDYPIVEKVRAAGRICGRWVRETTFVRTGLNSKEMVADLARHGVVAGSRNRWFPTDLRADLRRHYFRGLFDGDGSICPGRVRVRGRDLSPQWSVGVCGTRSCVRAFADFARDMTGSTARVRPHRTGIFYYDLHGNATSARLATALYADATVFLDRKHHKYLELTSAHGRPLRTA